jgi:hypothetical protein
MNVVLKMHLRKNALAQAEEPRPPRVWDDRDHKLLEELTQKVITINELEVE